ncbi:MAG: hypothetical protein QXU47_06555 [Candidatus Bathyarchaeia archaeon]
MSPRVWKGLVLLLAGLTIFSVYTSYVLLSENRQLRMELQQLEILHETLYGRLKELETTVEALNASYHRVLEANRELEAALMYLNGKLVVLGNFTLMEKEEFAEKYYFAYDREMVEFVMDATGGWDGTEEDFKSDLYRIYRAWRDAFTIDEEASTPLIPLLSINIGGGNYFTTEVGDSYFDLAEHLFYSNGPFIKIYEWSVVLSFRQRRGLCWSYAVVLTALYYIYSDITGRRLPVAYLSTTVGGGHGCVLLGGGGDLVAIVDWDPITVEGDKIKFIPVDEARYLHSRYWWGQEVDYSSVWMRPNTSKIFSSFEEFKKWLLEEFNKV